MAAGDPRAIDAALANERHFVLTLGGFALEIAGATLVTHERLPAPRFNFALAWGVGPERQTAFFERALDHYFQRALRPSFRVPLPVAAHVDAGLRRFGFRPKSDPLRVLIAPAARDGTRAPPPGVRPARRNEIDLVASFWTAESERPEFRAALEVAWAHPNPGEEIVPLLAFRAEEAISAAIVYRSGATVGIYAVATREPARGQGGASDLVRFATAGAPGSREVEYSIFSDSARPDRRLESLGFSVAARFQVYELPADAQLSLPPVAAAGPPRWRPPR